MDISKTNAAGARGEAHKFLNRTSNIVLPEGVPVKFEATEFDTHFWKSILGYRWKFSNYMQYPVDGSFCRAIIEPAQVRLHLNEVGRAPRWVFNVGTIFSTNAYEVTKDVEYLWTFRFDSKKIVVREWLDVFK